MDGHPRVVAVGETGFDYYHDHCPHGVQGEVFIRHLDLARRAGLPVVVHTREAAEDTLAVLAEHGHGLTVILHCFSLPELLDEVVERGYYLSFAGNVTYKNATDLQEAAQARARPNLLLLETDAPWLTPMPLRGTAQPAGPGGQDLRVRRRAARRRPSTSWPTQVEANARAAFPRLAALG